MKKILKQSSFLLVMAFSLIFTACESNDDALLIQEQEPVQVVQFTDGVPDFSNIDLSKEFSMDFNKIDISKLTSVDLNNMDSSKPFPTATDEGRFTPVPFVATIRGNNNRYISSENGNSAMTCNRSGVGPWEIFVFIPVPDGPNQFRIMGNTGRYMKVSYDKKAITCNERLRNATKFERIPDADGIGSYLRATGINRYISSENGSKPISCNRTWQLSWEKFTIAVLY